MNLTDFSTTLLNKIFSYLPKQIPLAVCCKILSKIKITNLVRIRVSWKRIKILKITCIFSGVWLHLNCSDTAAVRSCFYRNLIISDCEQISELPCDIYRLFIVNCHKIQDLREYKQLHVVYLFNTKVVYLPDSVQELHDEGYNSDLILCNFKYLECFYFNLDCKIKSSHYPEKIGKIIFNNIYTEL